MPTPYPRATTRRRPDRVQKIVRNAGEGLITLGVVLLLLVVYEVYWTDLISAGKQRDATSALDNRWNGNGAATDAQRQDHFQGLGDGEGFAKMYIPAFGADYQFTIVEGVSSADLEIGPGHYKKTAYPGQPGNFSVAGHRVGKGAPFNDIDLIQSCDAIVVETQYSWFVYRMLPTSDEKQGWAQGKGKEAKCKGVAPLGGPDKERDGQQIGLPTNGGGIAPGPPNGGNQPSEGDAAPRAERRQAAQQGRGSLADDADHLPPALLRQAAADRPRGADQAVGEGSEEAGRAAPGARGELMYGWIWRHLPGPVAVRVTLAVALA